MKLSQIQQLVAIKRHGNFTKASQALYITQPALSMSIRALEEELGEKLIARTNRGISFTPVGEQVLEHAERIMRESDEIFQICSGTSLTGQINLAATPHYCACLIVSVKRMLEEKYPNLKVNMLEYDSTTTLELVASGALSAGIIQHCDIGQIRDDLSNLPGNIQMLPLFEEDMVVAVDEHHPALLWDRVTVEDLAEFPYTAYKKAENVWVNQLLHKENRPISVTRINDAVPLRLMLRENNGYTIIPRKALSAGNRIYRDPLVPLNIPELKLTTKVSLAVSGSLPVLSAAVIHNAMEESVEKYRNGQ